MAKREAKKRRTIANLVSKSPETGDQFGRLKHGGLEWSDCLRIVGRDKPLSDMLANRQCQPSAVQTPAVDNDDASPSAPPIVTVTATADDYVPLDLQLAIQETPLLSEEPVSGTGYAAFTPAQRFHFLTWLAKVEQAAPTAFRQLYLAHLESNLFDVPARQQTAWHELLRLSAVRGWQQEDLLWRVLLLGFVLQGDGTALTEWLRTAPELPAKYLGVAIGQLAIFAKPLTVELLPLLLRRWAVATEVPDQGVLQLRLDYLNSTLEAEPLHHLLTTLDPSALQPRLWRTAHRSLRLRVAQPDLRQSLMPLLRELSMLTSTTAQTNTTDDLDDANLLEADTKPDAKPDTKPDASVVGKKRSRREDAPSSKQPWQLVLEFGDSRSEYFNYALNQARRMPGYIQIMDENRRMVHRVRFAKTDMRRFWSIWEYVQSWSSTQIYLNGKELQKWEIYPYSPYLR